MTIDPQSPDLSLGVIGTGTMGRGIAQIAAAGGISVRLYDARGGAAAEASAFVARMLRRAAEKGGMTEGAAEAAIGRLAIVDGLHAMADAAIVVEAIVEELEAKQRLFAELESIVSDDCILASNTSSLSVTAIAADCAHPERVAGWHFFNPVPLLKVVEVVDGLLTEPWVGDILDAIARRCGHRPVRAKDSPGFLVNHAGRGFSTEGLRIVQEGIAAAEGRRRHPARGGHPVPHGSLRADGHDRARRFRCGDGIDLPPILRGAAIPPGAAGAPAHGGGSLRAQDRARVL